MYRQPNLTLPVNRSRSNFVEIESLMWHKMFQHHRTLGSAEDFAIYGHDSYLGHVRKTILHKGGRALSPFFGPLQKPKYESYRTTISSRCFIS